MAKVKVKGVPVRYNQQTYKRGETFDMAEKHINESIVERVASSEKAPAKSPAKEK